MSDNLLLIFIKNPEPGRVKTRLAKDIGERRAALLYRAFVETIIERTADKGFGRIIFFDPPDKRDDIINWLYGISKFHTTRGVQGGDSIIQTTNRSLNEASEGRGSTGSPSFEPSRAKSKESPYEKLRGAKRRVNLIGDSIELCPQEGDGLGERLANAFESAFNKKARRAVVIGSDAPLIDSGIILDAFRRLERDECVIGPSLDGGYYLLGMSSLHKEIFQGVEWSTDKVFARTMSVLNRAGLNCSVLHKEFDVDGIDGLSALKDNIGKTKDKTLQSLANALSIL